MIFFFFQAEDGIRDSSVTGVQTCALPISIVSESLGMLTSAIERSPADHLSRQLLDVLAGRDRRLLEGQAVRHRHLGAAQPSDRCVQVVEAPLLHARRYLGGDALPLPPPFD